MRRLHDEYPKVVSSVAGNEVFWRRVLLQPTLATPGGRDIAALALRVEMSPAAVASSIRAVAMSWIGRMCEPRPKYPVEDACNVVLRLLRLLSDTATAAVTAVDFSIHMDGIAGRVANKGIAGGSMPSIIGLVLECLPGPHMMQWVKHAQELSSETPTKDVSPQDMQTLKKGLSDVAQEAVKVLQGLPGLSRPLGIFAVALGKAQGEQGGKDATGGKGGKGRRGGKVEKRNTFRIKTTGKPLEVLCEDVCVALGEALETVVEGEVQVRGRG